VAEFEVIHSRSSVFYRHFDRKPEMKHQTHYCPGCGHGVVHKMIADAIAELELQDKTVLICPVGCSVFGYYYLDVGNISAAHGRAAAVATGVNRACPDKVVISYQGDGDLAAIGTAEIIHAANRGEHMAVFFVNNAIYGMTGGQLAPTTLVGQVSTTSPWGRRAGNDGYPLRVSEMLAQLEMPTYIERVAVGDAKNIFKARRAVKKALELQKQKAGFALVEILSPCPTIWKKDPMAARKWVLEEMTKAFPLGVYRDRRPEIPVGNEPPQRTAAEVLEITEADNQRRSAAQAAEPSQTKPTLLKIAGFGGQGVLMLGQFLTEMGMHEGMEVSWLPSYGPEMRGGAAHCHVCLSHTRIGSPLVAHPDVLVAMNEVSLKKFAPQVRPGGLILYNRDVLPEDFTAPQARCLSVPASDIADHLGSSKVGNFVMLGALLHETGCLPEAAAYSLLETNIKNKALVEIDRQAIAAGIEYVATKARHGAVTQPDGFAY
jgi:2-oxoisovalerate ferredoxin oxidoreductase beta subunit